MFFVGKVDSVRVRNSRVCETRECDDNGDDNKQIETNRENVYFYKGGRTFEESSVTLGLIVGGAAHAPGLPQPHHGREHCRCLCLVYFVVI